MSTPSVLSPDGSLAVKPSELHQPRELSAHWWAILLAVVNIGYFLMQVALSTDTFFSIGSSLVLTPLQTWGACALMLAQAGVVFLRSRPVLMFALIIAGQFALMFLVGDRHLVVGVLLLFAVYNLTARTRRQVWVPTLALAAVIDYGLQIVDDSYTHVPDSTYVLVAYAVQTALNYATGIPAGLLVGAYRRGSELAVNYAQLVESEHEGWLAAALAAERAAMARELHDVGAHRLGGMMLQTNAALRRLDGDPEHMQKILETIRDEGKLAMQTLREMVDILREDAPELELAVGPSLGQLPNLIDSIRSTNPGTDLDVDGYIDDLGPSASLAGFRIIEESLSNARKHSPGSPVRVQVIRTGRELHIDVRNGATTAPESAELPSSGWGIVGMRERVTLLGGQLRSGPTDDGGWCTHATIPIDQTVSA